MGFSEHFHLIGAQEKQHDFKQHNNCELFDRLYTLA